MTDELDGMATLVAVAEAKGFRAKGERLAIAGLGVTLYFEVHVREAIEPGELVSVLEEFCTSFPGYYLYYPQRRQASASLRAVIEHLRAANAARRRPGGR